MGRIRVMTINAGAEDVASLESVLHKYPDTPYTLIHMKNLPEALEALSENRFDSAIITSNGTPVNLVDAYRILHHSMPELPVVVIAETRNEPSVAQVLNEGADDVITPKEMEYRILDRSLQYAIENKKRTEQIRRLLFTFEQIPASILIVDAMGGVDYINSQFSTSTGFNKNDIIAENIHDINKNGKVNEFFKNLEGCISGKTQWEGEIINKKQDGDIYWLHTSISPIKNTEGVITHYVAISQDITERKNEELALRQSEERFRTVVQNINEYIYSVTYDKGMVISTYHSPKCREITGYTGEELRNDTNLWFSMIYNDDKEHVNSFISYIFNKKETTSIEHRIIRKDGRVRWVSNTCAVQLDEEGEIWRLHGFLQDITERKEAEESLIQSERRLRLKNEKVEKDMKLAQLVQKAFLTKKIPEISNLSAAYRHFPLDGVGGDFFSINQLNKNTLSVFLGDVAGHGVSAALFLSLIKSATERISRKHARHTDQYITELNKILIEEMPSYFITAIYGLFLWDPENALMKFSYTNGAHPYPLYYSAQYNSYATIRKSSTIIGMFEEVDYGSYTIELHCGDRIFLMTDGIPEAENENHEMIGFEEKLVELFYRGYRECLNETLDSVIAELDAFRGSVPPDDDIVLMGFEVTGP